MRFMITYFILTLLCFILFVIESLEESVSRCNRKAVPVANFHDKILSQDILKIVPGVQTAAVCATLCFRTVNCTSFFYNKRSLRCQLQYSVLQDPANAIFEAVSRYYVLSADGVTLQTVCSGRPDYSYKKGINGEAELCYRHSADRNGTDRELTAEDARAMCTKDGGRLLQLETKAKTKLMKDILLNDFNDKSLNIGGTFVNGAWLWNWNASNKIQFSDWNTEKNEPNGKGDCIRLSSHIKFLWSSGDCNTNPRYYVCEIVVM